MADLNHNDEAMRDLLQSARSIAVVGHSEKPHRTSYAIAQYLRAAGYKVYPVNPTVTEIDGERCYASLAELPETPDIVNVFRRSEHLAEVIAEAIACGVRSIWTQLDVVDPQAQQQAIDAGLDVVSNRCIKVEHVRLRIN